MRHGAPLIAALRHIVKRVDDLAAHMARRASAGLDGGNQRLQQRPFRVTQIARIALARRDWKCFYTPSLLRWTGFQDSLSVSGEYLPPNGSWGGGGVLSA